MRREPCAMRLRPKPVTTHYEPLTCFFSRIPHCSLPTALICNFSVTRNPNMPPQSIKKTWDIKSPSGWRRIATYVASRLHDGDILAISGPLGAGKTTFVQALAKELGAKRMPKSPTFAMLRAYDIARGRLLHVDAYRIEDERDLLPLDLEDELLEPGSMLAIEWPEHIPRWLEQRRHSRLAIRLLPQGRRAIFQHA
ncbi:tRNA (adenosine(37)-N6)-threonylcarbamoyltransferase complex ATPase subunit type 1 TsaE [Candidatus Uhrbacteria bacterium]|nr:MAG: tRNA (adenosine(37)-N6)-threonylcarbamoyltransferase complex ATPase subunit type 1 TsaE [Candidatus Uhrbacteria bacterium]